MTSPVINPPWEVWAEVQTQDKAQSLLLYGHAVTLGIRYIRADLTCGKCELFNWQEEWGKPECPNVYDNGGYRPEEETPACTAFRPRVER